MKYCEDLLNRWDKRIQFEATLLFFFSVVSGSSYVSINMFTQLNVILNFIPLLYVATMFGWWYLCKRWIFNTNDPKIQSMLIINVLTIILWLIISLSVSLGGWKEWGWNKKDVEDIPSSDNIYRLINCALVLFYIITLTYDYYRDFKSRKNRIKLWTFYIWIHSIISFSYFVEWVIAAHLDSDYESIISRWFAAFGNGIIILWAIPIFFQDKLKKLQLILLFIALILYWLGSASLDCEFYADTADMTVMPGYQMLYTMALLILLESLPTMSNEIYILGTELLIDQELEQNQSSQVKVQLELINQDDNNNNNESMTQL